jgi:hypothetical protein
MEDNKIVKKHNFVAEYNKCSVILYVLPFPKIRAKIYSFLH